MTGPKVRTDPEVKELTEAQRKLYELLVDAYRADVAVSISSRTRKAFEVDMATASRTVARGVVIHGLADYSPEGGYLLLSRRGKALAGISVASREHPLT